jgi:hypothetical protein
MDVDIVKSKLIFNNKKDCEKSRYDWNKNFHTKKLTNPKFPTFDQQIYYAGDYDDLNRFAINQAYQFHLDIPKGSPNKNDSKTRIKFSDIETAFKYIFDKFKKATYVQIKNNKVEVYQPFSNYYYMNDYFLTIPNDKNDEYLMKKMRILYNKLKEADVFWKLEDFNEFDKLRVQAMNNLRKYVEKNPSIFGKKKINLDRTRLTANNCIFKSPSPSYEGSHTIDIYLDMLLQLVKTRKVKDCHFFLTLRDFPIVTKNHTEAYSSIFGDKIKLPAEFNKVSIVPIMSYATSKKFTDIDLPTYEDWLLFSKKHYSITNQCEQAKNEEHLYNSNWSSKKNVAIFRGKSTGCGTIIKNNMRLKSVALSHEYPELLDSAITEWNTRPRFQNDGLNLAKFSRDVINKYGTGSFVSMAGQSDYKYILYLDGHVSAVRLGASMGLHSLLLIPDSDYTIWIQEYLKPMVHFVPIKNDLSDLINKIKWCNAHDTECKKMAEESYKLYKKHVSVDGMLDHVQKVINEKINTNYIKQNRYRLKSNPLILIPFRCDMINTQEKGATTRTQQREYLVEYFKKVFVKSPDIKFIVQSKDGKFNRGQLLNIGFDYYYLNKGKKYTHIIFHDTDLLPDSNLIPYYDIIPSINKPLMLATKGLRYTRRTFNEMFDHNNNINTTKSRLIHQAVVNNKIKFFCGGSFSIHPDTFLICNGFPNNIAGWGQEDQSLGLRIRRCNIDTFIIPKKGRLIDIENNTILNITNKLNILRQKKLMFNQKWEFVYLDHKNSINDGINNMKYKVISDNKNEIIVQVSPSKINYNNLNIDTKILEKFNNNIIEPLNWIKFDLI